MCGLTGFIDPQRRGDEAGLQAIVAGMAATLSHRGPDDQGVWVDAGAAVALGARRLAILDLSPAGHQPMLSSCGRYVLAYNGEVYNFRELRQGLESAGVRFRGRSDTEVVIEGFSRWGIEATLRRLNGMFALAVWDRRDRALVLARDPLGIKPLYWGEPRNGLFLFGSELKALLAHPGWSPAVDAAAVAAYRALNYVPTPLSIYRGVRKLEPGRMVRIGPDGRAAVSAYWTLAAVVQSGSIDPLTDEFAALEATEAVLRRAVGRQLVADVPVGVMLSGGIDSSTVAAFAQIQSTSPVKTFTVGSAEPEYDEAAHARAIARHLGTDHTEIRLEAEDAARIVPDLPRWYDEPFGDSSQLAAVMVSRLARRQVTVALSGDGGDEVFLGYNRYRFAAGPWRRVRQVPWPLRRLVSAGLKAVPPARYDALAERLPRMPRQPGDKLHKFADVLALRDGAALYRRLLSVGADGEAVRSDGGERTERWLEALDEPERMACRDAMGYLPDDILTKLDRASMAASLEARVPLLDQEVVALAWRLPTAFKLSGGVGKRVLRRVLYRHVPPALLERPKWGFAVPVDHWLRGPLRDWAESLLAPAAFRKNPWVDPAPVQALWREHQDQRRNHAQPLWGVLMLQAWLENQHAGGSSAALNAAAPPAPLPTAEAFAPAVGHA